MTIVYGILLILLYFAIFSLSAQDGETSTDLSMRISGKCAELFRHFAVQQPSGTAGGDMAGYLEHPLRKLAHFTEYACMGGLVYLMWELWVERNWRLYLIPIVWVFISAGLDEIHQLFVPGRCGSFLDVCLDTAGGAAGLIVLVAVQWLAHRFARSR